MNNIEIFNQVDEDILELEEVRKVLYKAMEKEKLENTSFNLIIVDNNYIHALNNTYRHIDRETDVITFALEDEDTLVVGGNQRILGDIYISIDKAKSQAKEYGHSLLRELAFLAVHGFYHLLGYDHMNPSDEEVMFKKQDEVLDSCGIFR
ncbi:MAG: rRNA maturation RNase YbeY [bacterium]|nr:rRNA maturation RNase YbeY [bacterium]